MPFQLEHPAGTLIDAGVIQLEHPAGTLIDVDEVWLEHPAGTMTQVFAGIAGDFDLTSADNRPDGITFANDHFYSPNYFRDILYAYDRSGKYRSGKNISISETSGPNFGVVFANDRFYVGTNNTTYNKVWVFTSTGTYLSSASFNTASANSSPSGIAWDGSRLYIPDIDDDKVYAYSSSGTRQSSYDFDLALTGGYWNANGIVFANGRFYVACRANLSRGTSDDKVYAYSSSGTRQSSYDFDLASTNQQPRGITFAYNRFYVINDQTHYQKVFAYTSDGTHIG